MHVVYVITELVDQFASWVLPLMAFLAGGICFTHRRVSGWLHVLTLGFDLICFFLLALAVIKYLLKKDVLDQEDVQIAYAVVDLGLLFAGMVTLVGLAMTLKSINARYAVPQPTNDNGKQPLQSRPAKAEAPELDEVKDSLVGKLGTAPDKGV
jgi:hypothetical protein